MTDKLLAALLVAMLRFIASDPVRMMAFRRELLKMLYSKDPDHVCEGARGIAKQIELMYTQVEG